MPRSNPMRSSSQPPGVLKLCKELVPRNALHLSTQANVLNVLDAKVYYEMGASALSPRVKYRLKTSPRSKKSFPTSSLRCSYTVRCVLPTAGAALSPPSKAGAYPTAEAARTTVDFPYEIYAANPETGTLFKLEEEEGIGTYIMKLQRPKPRLARQRDFRHGCDRLA